MDLFKLTDTFVVIPPLNPDLVRSILGVAYAHWSEAGGYIDTLPRGRAPKLKLDHSVLRDHYIRRRDSTHPVDAISTLLSSPRAVKHLIREVDYTWSQLKGEARLSDVILIAALQYGVPPVHEFLIKNIDAARVRADRDEKEPSRVKQEWEALLAGIQYSREIRTLVDLLGIAQLTSSTVIANDEGPQDICHHEPTDYFRRILAKSLGSDEVRDQQVLEDIREWRNRRSNLLQELLASTDNNDRYAAVWEHFADRSHSNDELFRLADQVIGGLLSRDGVHARGDHPSLIAVWRRINRRGVRDRREWLQGHIVRSSRTSLNFANDLFYYWTGQYGVVTDNDKFAVRETMVNQATTTLASAEGLIRVLSDKHPYALVRLITLTGESRDIAQYEAWSWLGPVLITAGQMKPELILPEIAALVQTEESGMMAAKEGPPVFLRSYEFDAERLDAIFGEDKNSVLAMFANYDGSNVYALRPQQTAAALLRGDPLDQLDQTTESDQ